MLSVMAALSCSSETVKPMASSLFFFVNGKRISAEGQQPDRRLASFLRQELRLTGCKIGCGVGVCGSCTVLLSCLEGFAANGEPQVVHAAVNACLLPLATCHAKSITTVEGLGSARDRLQPLQTALAKGHGVQCGFCSPGFIMSAYAALRAADGAALSPSQLEAALRGNLCRCTGYRPIVRALKDACCGGSCTDCPGAEVETHPAIDLTQELLFPPELLLIARAGGSSSLRFSGEGISWIEPASWSEAVTMLRGCPDAVIVGGNSDKAIVTKGPTPTTEEPMTFLSLSCLKIFESSLKGLSIGCGLTLAQLEIHLKAASCSGDFGRELLSLLRDHSSVQVKNVATVGGSIVSCHTYPFFLVLAAAAGASLLVWDRQTAQERTLKVSDFLRDFNVRRFVLRELSVPPTSPLRLLSLRQSPFHTCLAAAADERSGLWRLAQAIPQEGNEGSYSLSVIEGGRQMMEMAPEAVSDTYSRSLLRHWTKEALTMTSYQIIEEEEADDAKVGSGVQSFAKASLTSDGPVGQPVMTSFSLEATSGEAEFIDDITPVSGELHLGLVRSDCPHARILEIDATAALTLPGVVTLLTAKDVPNNSVIMSVPPADEEVFASEYVHYVGQPVGAVVADSQETALRAAAAVKVKFAPEPAILGIPAALKASSFLRSAFCASHESRMHRGEPEAVLGDASVKLRVAGELMIDAQEHFYLEPHSAIALPSKEGSELVVYASSHSPSDAHRCVATMLELPLNRVTMKVRRLGGSFGGKEVRGSSTAQLAALAAWRLRRPVRCVLPRRVDFEITGHRHPMFGGYEVVLEPDRLHVKALRLDLTYDGGYSLDVSTLVRGHGLMKALHSYRVANVDAVSRAVRTNRASNTAFRGFGGPQGVMLTEMALEHTAEELQVCPDALREANILREGEEDSMKQKRPDNNLRRCWDECWRRAEYAERREAIKTFNAKHTDVKRGLAMVPIAFMIGYDAAFLNQASALLHVYKDDGSILLAHGGVEMGQGLDTKMRQLVAQEFSLPLAMIHSQPTSTAVIPNLIPTASSCGSDLIGNAVLDACRTLKARLQWCPNSEETEEECVKRWKGVIFGSFFGKISLSAQGFFAHPVPDASPEDGGANFYNTFGAACSEVELCVATGEHRLLRADIVMDLGRSLNPAVDIGQIEGGFLQGYGLFCRERLPLGKEGLAPRAVEDYAVPRIHDVPGELNVHLLEGTENTAPHAVFSSKSTGEPPFFLGCSAYLAVRRAVRAVAEPDVRPCCPRIDCPATSDRVRAAIEQLLA